MGDNVTVRVPLTAESLSIEVRMVLCQLSYAHIVMTGQGTGGEHAKSGGK